MDQNLIAVIVGCRGNGVFAGVINRSYDYSRTYGFDGPAADILTFSNS